MDQKEKQNRGKLFYEAREYFLENSGIGRLHWKASLKGIQNKEIEAEVKKYIILIGSMISKGKGLVLVGDYGLGKTSILALIGIRAWEIGRYWGYMDDDEMIALNYKPSYHIRFITVKKLCSILCDDRAAAADYLECDLLLLDDFGREYDHNYPVSELSDFIDYRYSNMKSTIVSTAMSIDQLRELKKYASVIDRFRDKKLFTVLQLTGKSQRRQK